MRIFLFSLLFLAIFMSCDDEAIIPMPEVINVDSLIIEANNILPNSGWNLIDTLDADSLHNGIISYGGHIQLSFTDTLTGREFYFDAAGFENFVFSYSISNDANYSNGPLLHFFHNSKEDKYVIHFISSTELLMELVETNRHSVTEDVFVYYEAG